MIPEPGCLQPGNPAGFPLGQPQVSSPGFVYWLPGVIYHGFHGAVMDRQGRIYTEPLDCLPEHFEFSQIKRRPLHFKGRVMALSCTKNYFHWLLKMLPRLHMIERSEGSLDGIDAFFINKPTWQQEQVYRRLQIWDRCTVIDNSTYAVCRMLAAPSLAHDAAAWACRWVRTKLCPPEPSKRGRRIYAIRGNTAQRCVINEDAVCKLLENYGFEIVDCSTLGVEEQAGLFAQSDIVVAVHGAALSNLVFCKPGTTVLEIFGAAANQKVYWLMSHRMGLRYYCLMAGPADAEGRNLVIDLELLSGNIERLISPPSVNLRKST